MTNPATLAIYAQDLSNYSIEVISAVLDAMGLESPAEYKQLWPAVGTILDAVRRHIYDNRPLEPTSGDRWAAHVEDFWKEPPAPLDDEIQARVDALNEKFGLKKEKEIEIINTDLICPKCQFSQPVAGNLRNWTAKEIYEYAAVVEQLEVIAERNRNMPNLPLAEVVEEISA